ncbi:flavin monoamine oxidase [Sphaerisporangium melleum]|uniref:Flavin monoamine oxidase n=1 Tax=Sphaerisporangium melleum TaxID=321316 RepID=A0A917QVA6_9ACTN|nr:FAD-dependent oxidoreductase [Sphaerisporangium melleum]GGK71100.1 flavin monoamine oxidase [Sphaerisporangium melleum]GII70217.1 flavin monoamine oxidase [Sphaerisporangium melleum]
MSDGPPNRHDDSSSHEDGSSPTRSPHEGSPSAGSAYAGSPHPGSPDRGAAPDEAARRGGSRAGHGPSRLGGLTRRSLLVGIGAAGGAGAMYAAMGVLGLAPSGDTAPVPVVGGSPAPAPYVPPQRSDFALRGGRPASVLVLGGGVAGLACAYELGKAGYDCTVLEARDRVGGRNLTLRGGDTLTELPLTATAPAGGAGGLQRITFGEGTYFNAGPARIAQWMVTLDYCRELGVPLEVFVNGNSAAYVLTTGMKTPVRVRTARADAYGYVSELLAKATDEGALDARLTAADKERLLDFLSRFGEIGPSHAYAGGERRGFRVNPGVGPGEGLGVVPSLTEVLSQGLGRVLTMDAGYEQAMPMFQPVGGMDAIVRALAARVGADRIRTGTRVTRITSTAAGVEVAVEGGAPLRAEFCVAALPPHLLAGIPGNLGAKVRSALSAAVPVSAGKLGLEYGRRWWEIEDRVYGGATETDLDVGHIWYPSYGFHGERGLVVGYYNTGADAEVYSAMTHPRRLRRALAQGRKVHGAKYAEGVLASASISWRRQPHIEGAWVRWSSQEAFRLLQRPAGRVYFAGDWLTHLIAWQAGALESARKVVTELHHRVLKEA